MSSTTHYSVKGFKYVFGINGMNAEGKEFVPQRRTDHIFVIGNGPSLNEHLERGHFDKLVDHDTFGVNKIHLMYPNTKWRPTYWSFFDRSNDLSYKYDIYDHLKFGYPCFVREDIFRASEMPTLYSMYNCNHLDVDREPTTEWHEPTVCKMGGSVYAAIQMSVYMGYSTIYVIGCDLGLVGNGYNHFTKDYLDPDNFGVRKADVANRNLVHSHKVCRKECDKRGVEIYNAGIGGKLNAYERVDIEELL